MPTMQAIQRVLLSIYQESLLEYTSSTLHLPSSCILFTNVSGKEPVCGVCKEEA